MLKVTSPAHQRLGPLGSAAVFGADWRGWRRLCDRQIHGAGSAFWTLLSRQHAG
ncbi:MAG: hypothetical protein HC812_02340 [Leptolyngbya sp. RL_3_1]|nr:hypothetical protein [Leptolyngbya sp. RL_3_1]